MNSSRQASISLALGFGLAFGLAACSSSTPSPAGQTSSQAGTGTANPGAAGASTAGPGGAGPGPAPGAGAGGTASTTPGAGAGGASAGSGPSGGAPPANAGAGGAPDPQAGAPATAGAAPVVTLPDVVTSADGAFWKTATLTPVTSGTADVTADAGSKKQRWDGFGGTFNEAGWDALSVLSASDRQLALQLLFDAAMGANFAYGRLPIGASDYAITRYTLAETANDYDMASFSIAHDKTLLIPFIKAAQLIKPSIHFWSSPWTPPAWMKSNNSTDQGSMKDDKMVLQAFALYLEKYVQAYAAEGITIEAVHPQNEPGYGTNPYPCCSWSSDLYIKFIRDYLGPQFKKDNVPAQIWCGTMSAEGDATIAKNMAADSAAMAYVKGFGLQWNTQSAVSSLKGTNQPIMQTEHRCGNYSGFTSPHATSTYDANKPQNDFAYGVESWGNLKDWIDAGVNSYSAWNMVLDTLGTNLNATKPWHQNALLVVDRSAKKLIQTPAYYVFRHLSYFVAPGATVIGATGGSALAFQNPDGAYVVVMYNSGAAKKATVSLGGTLLQFDMPANGFATVHHMK